MRNKVLKLGQRLVIQLLLLFLEDVDFILVFFLKPLIEGFIFMAVKALKYPLGTFLVRLNHTQNTSLLKKQ